MKIVFCSRHSALLAPLGLLLATGCGGMNAPSYAPIPPDVPREIEGMKLVTDGTFFDREYRKPGLDLTRYSAILPAPLSLVYTEEYEREHRFDRMQDPDRMVPESRLEQYEKDDLAKLRRMFRDALVEHLTRDGAYRIVGEREPGALIVAAGVIDLDLRPAHADYDPPGAQTVTPAPVVLVGTTLRDGTSDEKLAQLFDAERQADGLERSSVFWSQVDYALNRWAAKFRAMLDAAHASQGSERAGDGEAGAH